MKKVAHLTSAHPVLDSRIFFKECCSLRDFGYQVILIAQAEQDHIVHGIEVRAIKPTKSRWIRMSYVLWQIYRQAKRENAAVYHIHDPELILVALLLRLQNKTIIYDVHEDVPRDILLKAWIPTWSRKGIAAIVEKIEQYAAKRFQGIVTVTPQITQRFSAFKPVEVRNYPIIDPERDAELRRGSNLICYAGLINKQRGIMEMIHVAQQANCQLALAGTFNCSSVSLSVLKQPHVVHRRYLPREQLQSLYNRSLVGLVILHPGPTFNTSLPIKLFEYMAAGLPVIASDFPLWRDIIERHDCGWCINPYDIDAITEKVLLLKNNQVLAREMGARGRQAVVDFYNWQEHAAIKLAALYQRLVV